MNVDQWNLISNLSHCYDDHAGLAIGEQYMSQQNSLPHRFRFKSASILQLYQMTFDGAQSLYANNGDFRSLCANDRSILLHSTLSCTASISSNFILCKIQLMEQSAYFDAMELITSAYLVTFARRLPQRLKFDVIVMKMLLAILSFSTFRYTVYPSTSSGNLSNVQEILCIQDRYIDLTWRYLLFTYDQEQAVKCFSDFIRCVFVVNEGIVQLENVQWFTEDIDSLTEKVEQVLSVND